MRIHESNVPSDEELAAAMAVREAADALMSTVLRARSMGWTVGMGTMANPLCKEEFRGTVNETMLTINISRPFRIARRPQSPNPNEE